jgi:peptidoglycan hydrolase-like protein with peptidoglycan-binding domain
MSPLAIGVGGIGLLLLLAGKGKAATTAPRATSAKSVAQRMAEALATNNPAAIRLEAGRLRVEGSTTQAADLERAAAAIEAERAPAPSSPAVPSSVPVRPPPVAAPSSAPPVVAAPPAVVVTAPPPASAPPGMAPTITAALKSLPAILGVQFEGTGKSTKQVFKAPRSAGQAVKDWQTVLVQLGFMTAAPDGKFGNATEIATRAFQAAANESAKRSGKPLLDVDGLVGPKTVARAAEARVVSGGPSTFTGDDGFGFDPMFAPSSPQPDTPLPGVMPPMAPAAPNPRRALAARLYNHLSMAPAGGEDRTLVALYQAQEGLKPTGYYGPSTALSLAHSYGIVPPKPLHWTESRTGRSKSNYRGALLALAARDPQRSEEWTRAAKV